VAHSQEWNIWIDLQLSLAEIEALANPFRAQEPGLPLISEIPDLPDELPRIPTVGYAMGQPELRWAIDDVLNRMRQDHADSDD
jgi:hypothetical protein